MVLPLCLCAESRTWNIKMNERIHRWHMGYICLRWGGRCREISRKSSFFILSTMGSLGRVWNRRTWSHYKSVCFPINTVHLLCISSVRHHKPGVSFYCCLFPRCSWGSEQIIALSKVMWVNGKIEDFTAGQVRVAASQLELCI